MKAFLVNLICVLSIAPAMSRAEGAFTPPLPAGDGTISLVTFCIAKVREVAVVEYGGSVVKVRVVQVLHRAGPNPYTWRGRLWRVLGWFWLHPGTCLTIPLEVRAYGPALAQMTVLKGDTVLLALEKTKNGFGLVDDGIEMMPRCLPLRRITGSNDPAVVALQRVFDLSDELDKGKKVNRLMRALRADQNVVVVDYAFNTLLRFADDPLLNDRICDKLVRSFVRYSLMLAADGRAEEIWDRRIAFVNQICLYGAKYPTRNEKIREELSRIRDKETIPIIVRMAADSIICEISPPEDVWSAQRMSFLKGMIKRADVQNTDKRDLECMLQHAEELKRESEQPRKPEIPRTHWQPTWPLRLEDVIRQQ